MKTAANKALNRTLCFVATPVRLSLGRMDRRQEFLAEFLAALGAHEIRHLALTPDSVSGTVVYDPSDSD